jgi:hypothetical protein
MVPTPFLFYFFFSNRYYPLSLITSSFLKQGVFWGIISPSHRSSSQRGIGIGRRGEEGLWRDLEGVFVGYG